MVANWMRMCRAIVHFTGDGIGHPINRNIEFQKKNWAGNVVWAISEFDWKFHRIKTAEHNVAKRLASTLHERIRLTQNQEDVYLMTNKE